jgi:pilus assembly protein CpaF
MINGPGRVYIERRGTIERTETQFSGKEAVLCALRNAAQFVGKSLDEQNPMLEARLPDGSRLQAVIPPAAPEGPCVSIRRFLRQALDLDVLIETGSLTPAAALTLEVLIRGRLNLLVAGGTGSGKTSLLNVLTRFVRDEERTLVIEDSKEIVVQRDHVVYLEARPADPNGRGAVSIRDLFRASLRMRPDRIVIGEIRGAEALDIVQAMVSGHGGCMGTLHATYPRDTLTRLETMALMSDVEMPLLALRNQIASGVNVIVQVAREQDGTRKVTHITQVEELGPDGRYQLIDIFAREYKGIDAYGNVISELLPSGRLPTFIPALRSRGLDLPSAVYEAAARAAERPA